ncbi:uncharacterized protein [Primulina eburnea]|uniref:uncharacterized protein n=1 Tax=Primulina eburnea TaxID=1245227 RepID=UPI003C6CB24D
MRRRLRTPGGRGGTGLHDNVDGLGYFIERTPTKAGSFPVDPTMNPPYYLTPGTSTEINLNHSGASANMTDSCARDAMTSCDPPGQSQSSTTPAAADLHNVLTPHTRYQTHDAIVLCLPAQQNRSKTSKSQPIRKKQQPKNLASSSQMTDNRFRSLKPEPGTPTKAGSFPVDPTMNPPYYLTPGTSTEINLNHSGASANMTDSCARDAMTSCDPPGQSQSSTTPAAADLHNVLTPHTRYQTHDAIVLCLPAQQNISKTSKSQPIRKKQQPKNLASSSQMTDNRSLKPEPGTPTKAGSFPVDPTMNPPYDLTPGTSTEINLNHPGASANMTDSCAREDMTSRDPPGQSQSPTTPAAAVLHNVLSPHTRYQTHAGIILGLPAQQKRFKTSKSQPICKKQQPKNLASSSEMTDNRSRSLKPESNIPVRPKELTRDETRCMLMNKARTEVIRYLRD